jgi:hypothetical protein
MQSLRVLVSVLVITASSWASAREIPPISLPYGSMLYYYFQDDPQSALTEVLFDEERGSIADDEVSLMALAKVSLALDLSLNHFARGVLDEIDANSLDPYQHDRLNFYFAKHAYLEHEWDSVREWLAKIDSKAVVLRHPEALYLKAEIARFDAEFEEAERFIGRLPGRSPYRPYVKFNLGIAAKEAGDMKRAFGYFEDVADTNAITGEHWELAERASIALAHLEIESGATEDAMKRLADMAAEGEYGKAALAAAAIMAMKEESFEEAIRIWHYIREGGGWHPATIQARVALPFCLERLDEPMKALAIYREAQSEIAARMVSLGEFADRLADPAEQQRLLKALATASGEVTRTTLMEFDRELSHREWLYWLSDDTAQDMIAAWRRFTEANENLTRRRDDMDILLEVDAEQQRRIHGAASTLERGHYLDKMNAISAHLEALQRRVSAMISGPSIDPGVMELATAEEREILAQVDAMRARARSLGGGVDLMARLDRVQGVILWQIAEDVPERARALGAEAERLGRLVAESRKRAARIVQAANALGTPDSVSGRIVALSDRIDNLLFDTKRALDWTGATLIARIQQGLRHEMAWLDQHLTYTRLAVARIGDAQLVASAKAPE